MHGCLGNTWVTATRETAYLFSKVLLNTIADNPIDASIVFRVLSSEGIKQRPNVAVMKSMHDK